MVRQRVQASSYYLTDICCLYDADGNLITVPDTTVAYTAPVSADPWEGLTPVTGETELDAGFENISAAGWAQAGVNTTLNTDVLEHLDLLQQSQKVQ